MGFSVCNSGRDDFFFFYRKFENGYSREIVVPVGSYPWIHEPRQDKEEAMQEETAAQFCDWATVQQMKYIFY